MLAALGMADLPGVVKVDPVAQDAPKFCGGYASRGAGGPGSARRYYRACFIGLVVLFSMDFVFTVS
ncbi:hypothetical protein MKW94_016042 [Papaver nudicaule]|uniref:Uncharacterized protein n=1 Tax=Papaver nudicaule TaxID=74823 RepID=A0AA41UUR8_PAPNU|nr:hypothetical protein [Papaver nudicaule]